MRNKKIINFSPSRHLSSFIWMLLFSALFITACSAEITPEAACVVLGGIPKAPSDATDINDSNFNALLNQLEQAFQTSTKVTNVTSKAYYTRQSFSQVETHYTGLLDQGWSPRPNLVTLFSGQKAQVGAWSSCTDELLVVLYYANISDKGSGLIVLYAKP